MPKDIEHMVKKLEKHENDIESPWGLSVWMKKKGYKMPAKAEEEKYELPTEKQKKELDSYEMDLSKKVLDASKEHAKKASVPKGLEYIKISDKKETPTTDTGITPVFKDHKKTDTPIKELAEEVGLSKEYGLPSIYPKKDVVPTPKEQMETYKPKGTKPTFIDTKPSGKGKSLEEWASESDEDMLVYPDEFKCGMKEETEHADVVGTNKEAIKKIVLAHLKEDPRYYSKLGTVMKAEEEGIMDKIKKVLDPSPKMPKEEKHIPLTKTFVRRQKQKAEEEGIIDKVKDTVKDLTSSPKPREEKHIPLTKTFVRKQMQKAEEDTESERDYTVWQQEKHEEKSKPLLKRVSEKLFGEKAEEERRPSSIRKSMKRVPHEKDVIRHLQIIDPIEKKAEEDGAGQYLKDISKPKDPLATIKKIKKYEPTPIESPKMPTEGVPRSKHLTAPDPGFKKLFKEYKSKEFIQKAEEELGEPQKAFDEDALNELYCFLRWMSDKGFKAEDGDKFEALMDRYEVEKFSKEAEEMQSPAEFQAPQEKK